MNHEDENMRMRMISLQSAEYPRVSYRQQANSNSQFAGEGLLIITRFPATGTPEVHWTLASHKLAWTWILDRDREVQPESRILSFVLFKGTQSTEPLSPLASLITMISYK